MTRKEAEKRKDEISRHLAIAYVCASQVIDSLVDGKEHDPLEQINEELGG